MKKLFLLLTVLLASSSLMAGVTRTIDVATAGSLPDLISESEKYEIEELTLTGELNGTDFRLLRDMAGNNCYGQATEGKLKTLDFSGAKVIAGGEMYLDTDRIEGKGFGISIYPAIRSTIETNNVLPQHLFSGCTLESVIISNSIDKIDHSAFSSCYQLVSAVLPENVVTLGNGIFYQCRLLKNLIIPSRVSSIGTQFISGCTSLESVVVDNQNETYDSRNNCNAIIEKTSNILVAGCSLTMIPEGVVEIGSHAMEDCTFSSIKLPESLQKIGINGFRGCLNLEYIAIPAAVATISQGAFSKCKNLKSIVVDSNNQYFDSRNNCNAIIQSTTDKLILGCPNSVIPEGINAIGSYAFTDGITTIEIPSSITLIEDYAFPWSLNSVKMMSKTPPIISVKSFPNYKNMMLIVPTGYTGAYTSADYWKDFKIIVDSRPVIFADKTAKALCVANWDTNRDGELSEVEAAAVTDLGTVFKNNKEIKSFDELEYFIGITTIGDQAFLGCISLISLTIPSNVTSIGAQAFFGCTSLTNLTIPSSVTSISAQAFNYCSDLTSIIVEEENTVFDSRDNCNAIINKVDNKLLYGCMNTIIPNSVASIGEFAFFGCSNLTSITIPSSVKTIYSYAFNDCRNLSSLTIDNGLTSIGISSFIDCKSLTEIVFPNTLVSIGESAFWRCGFTSVTIPANLSSLGNALFVGCDNLDQIQVSTDNLNYTSEDGVLFNKDKSELICFPMGKKSSDYSIPNSVTKIAPFAFHNCTNLASVQVSDCLQTIGNSAFGECTSLESIVIPRSVQSIGSFAFSNCKALTSVTSELATPFDIEEDVFFGNTSSNPAMNVDIYSTATLYVPTGLKSLYQSKTGWSNFDNIEELDIDPTKQTIHVATAGTLPDLISESEKYTIEELTLTGYLNGTDFRLLRDMCGNNYLGKITEGKLRNLDLSGVKIIAGGEKYLDTNVISLKNNSGYGGSFHLNVSQNNVFPENVFTGCTLFSLILPNSITKIGSMAFHYCSGLTSVTIPNSVENIGHCAFWYCDKLVSLTIPNSVTIIEGQAFEGCAGITSITIPNSVTSIGYCAFSKCSSLSSIIVESDNSIYDSRNDCNAIIETATNTLVQGCKNTTIPNSVVSVGSNAFEGCTDLISITIPNSVTSIGEASFFNSGLKSITIPNSVTKIDRAAFSNCSRLTSIVVESGNSKYDSRNGCNAIVETASNTLIYGCKCTTIPNSVTTIGEYAFWGCSDLTSITIPNTVTNIEGDAFYMCNGLLSISIPNSITNIKRFTFYGCNSLTSISIPNSVTSIEDGAFYGCTGLTSIVSQISTPFDIDDNVFTNYSTATLTVPVGTKAVYQETNGWKNFTNIEEVTLTPMDDQDEINYGEDGNVDGNTNLEGTIIDNVYYNITQENGGFDTEDKCIVVNKAMSDEEIESVFGKDLQSDEVKQTFTGLVIEVPAGKGNVKIDAQTTGGMTLKVKIGSADPVIMEIDGKLKVTVPYNVIEPTYVYIYAGEATASVRRRSGDESEKNLRIYGLSIDAEEFVKGNVNADESIDIADAVSIVNYIVGKPTSTSAFIKAAADANGDGVIDIADAVHVVNLIVGKINAFARQRDVTLPDPE